MTSPVAIFCCYAHEDELLLKQLKNRLMPWHRQGLVTLWADTDIDLGSDREEEKDKHLNTAQIILLLISPDFMASDDCYDKEMTRAMERHEKGEARVIPILLRPTSWQDAPFSKLQVLPVCAKPVTDPSWHNLDSAFVNLAESIREIVEELRSQGEKSKGSIANRVNILPKKRKQGLLRTSILGAFLLALILISSSILVFGHPGKLPITGSTATRPIATSTSILTIIPQPTSTHASVSPTPQLGLTQSDVQPTSQPNRQPTPTPTPIKPGGMWITPSNNFTITQGQTLQLSAHAYPTNKEKDPAIAYVQFTASWNGQSSGPWPVLARVSPTAGTDVFSYTWDLTYQDNPIPSGSLRISFDVYDVQGNYRLAPNGVHDGIVDE